MASVSLSLATSLLPVLPIRALVAGDVEQVVGDLERDAGEQAETGHRFRCAPHWRAPTSPPDGSSR